MAEHDLESLYREAQSALKARDYVRAGELLRQILVIDENYKDVSRLLANVVKLKRRRWYNNPRLWGALGFVMIAALGFFIAPRLRGLYAVQPSAPVIINSPTAALPPTAIATATETPPPVPTSIPMTWKRVSIGQDFERDTVTAFVIDPKDQDVLYADMKNAGVYKSIDGGLSWRPAHQGLSNTQVTSLLIDSQSPRILYSGTLGGIFKTEDGGENWARIGEGTHVLMDSQDSSHLYARDSDSIYESTDQGRNWETVYSAKEGCPGKILSWDIHPTDGKTLFIGSGEECEPGVYLSADGGHTWKMFWPIGNENYQYLDRLAIGMDKQENYYIASAWGLRRNQSNTGEINWKFLADFAPPAAFDSAGFVYFHCDTHLCKFNPDDEQKAILGKPDVGTGPYPFTTITISSYDPNTIYVSGVGISVSRDGGLTWTKLNNGLGNTLLHLEAGFGNASALYLLPGECEQTQIQSDEGGYTTVQTLYVSNNGGITWGATPQTGCHLTKDADGLTLYRIGASYDWFGGARRGMIWRSQDGGKSWQRVLTPNFIKTIIAHTSQTGLLYGFMRDPYHQTRADPNFPEEEYFYSDDYGDTWNKQEPPVGTKPCYGSTLQFIDAYRPMAIDPFDGNHVFVIDNGLLLESHNSCDTTETFATPPTARLNSITFDPNKSDIIYAGTDGGAYISYDSGKTWGQVNDGLLGATVVYSIAADKDGNVYAATPYGIFKLESK